MVAVDVHSDEVISEGALEDLSHTLNSTIVRWERELHELAFSLPQTGQLDHLYPVSVRVSRWLWMG